MDLSQTMLSSRLVPRGSKRVKIFDCSPIGSKTNDDHRQRLVTVGINRMTNSTAVNGLPTWCFTRYSFTVDGNSGLGSAVERSCRSSTLPSRCLSSHANFNWLTCLLLAMDSRVLPSGTRPLIGHHQTGNQVRNQVLFWSRYECILRSCHRICS